MAKRKKFNVKVEVESGDNFNEKIKLFKKLSKRIVSECNRRERYSSPSDIKHQKKQRRKLMKKKFGNK